MTCQLWPEGLEEAKSSEPSRRRSVSDDAEEVEGDVRFPSDDEIDESVDFEDGEKERRLEWKREGFEDVGKEGRDEGGRGGR